MDYEAILASPESVLVELGLKRGDVYALKALCSTLNETRKRCDQETRKRQLVQEILKGRQYKTQKRKTLKITPDLRSKSKTRTISLGWMHYDESKGKYMSIRAKRGGGTRSLVVKLSMSKEELIEEGKSLFFENGASCEGEVCNMEFGLVNFKGEHIGELKDKDGKDVPFSIQGYFDMYKLSKVFLYLSSKYVPFTESDDERELEKSPFDDYSASQPADKGEIWRQNLNKQHEREMGKHNGTHSSFLIGTSEERQVLRDEQDKTYQQSLETDRKKTADRIRLLEQEVAKVERLKALQQSRLERVPSESDDDCVRIIVQHCSEGRISRQFAKEESMTAVYDWVGSHNIHPEFYRLTRTAFDSSLQIKVSPSDRVEKHQNCILYMGEQEEPIPIDIDDSKVSFRGFGSYMDPRDNNDTLPYDEDVLQIAPVYENVPDQLLEGDSAEEDGPANTSEEASEVKETGKQQELRHRCVDALRKMVEHVYITVHRDAVFDKALALYQDISFCRSSYPCLQFEGEDGEDVDGLTRDFFSVFWEKAFIGFCEGAAGTFIPRTSPDVTEDTVRLLGRIASHGYVLCGIFPVFLCKSFVLAAVCGADAVTEDELLSSFLAYNTDYEREVLQKALAKRDGATFSSDLEEALIDVLEPYNMRKIPTPSSLRAQVVAIAKCEFVNKISWAVHGFKKGLADCHDIWNETSKEEISIMYADLVPTPASVLALFQVEDESQLNSAKEVVLNYLKRMVRSADDALLRKILRFITGSELATVKKITIVFHANTGSVPEIIAHTCASVLDLPSSGYHSFIDFREQLKSVLNNPLSWKFNVI